MRLPRFSTSRLMVVVGIVALNLFSLRFWSHSSSPSPLTGRVLICVALRVGLVRLLRGGGPGSLAFWSGFVAFGLAAALTTVYVDFFSDDGSGLFALMDWYLYHVYNFLRSACGSIGDPYVQSRVRTELLNGQNTVISNALYETVCSLPQLLVAAVGGLLAGFASRGVRGASAWRMMARRAPGNDPAPRS